MKKIALIGGGQIGGTLALLSLQKNLGKIVLLDVFGDVAKGKSLDLGQMSSLLPTDSEIIGTDNYADIKDADVCIITAGFPRKPGMTREDLLSKNLSVIKTVANGIKTYAPTAFNIVVTNPLDIMVYAFHKFSSLSHKKIVGMAGVLDSARFRYFLSQSLNISRKDVQAMVLGGHGDDMVPLLRFSTASGVPLTELVKMGKLSEQKLQEIIAKTRTGGGDIVKLLGTGSAFYAPALSAMEMAESYLFDQKRLLPCASYLQGQYGVKDLFIGVPTIIGKDGCEEVVELELSNLEKSQLEKSIASVKKVVAEVNEML